MIWKNNHQLAFVLRSGHLCKSGAHIRLMHEALMDTVEQLRLARFRLRASRCEGHWVGPDAELVGRIDATLQAVSSAMEGKTGKV